ncbi:hypothetical protein KUTeg_018200 [Tegillarca granosa]|uniref:Uncharacterized protein n=1 Tax=Tegillarca granosa TaxID=220873 RepID=A0ABQ9ELZ8_TEGGR|nr:hypothetical protein KUTeg_018200 [Tegillarca granosa]
MKQISEAAMASTVKILAHAGVPNREIMKISGNKCEASLDFYNADSSDKQKRSYSWDVLSSPQHTCKLNAVEQIKEFCYGSENYHNVLFCDISLSVI